MEHCPVHVTKLMQTSAKHHGKGWHSGKEGIILCIHTAILRSFAGGKTHNAGIHGFHGILLLSFQCIHALRLPVVELFLHIRKGKLSFRIKAVELCQKNGSHSRTIAKGLLSIRSFSKSIFLLGNS